MQPKDFPAREEGPETSESSASGRIIGHILHERFLVERDLTDQSLGGGFSAFLVKDLKNYCREAILKLSRSVPDDSGADGPSLKEVSDALARLRHPNIEEIVETGRFADGRPFILTPPYAATSLDGLIAPGKRLELEGIAQLVEQVADGLSAAHSKGVLHCDLRPANILVPAGEIGANDIRIVNFGSAWPLDVRGESLVNVASGSDSLHYAAPELLVKLGHRSTASDIYSLSVLVYRLVTGTIPFEALDRAGLLDLINAGRPVPPTEMRTDLSDEAEKLVLAGLDFEPARRPQDVGEFALRLVRMLRPPKGLPLLEVPVIVDEVEPEPPKPEARKMILEQPRVLTPIAETRDRHPAYPASQRPPVSDRAVAWALIILLMAGALSIPIGQTFLREKTTAAAVDTMADRPAEDTEPHRLRYWFEPKGGAPYQHYSSGGASEQVAFASDSPGHAYVFYEFAGGDGRPSYEMRFPAADATEAAKGVEANKPVKPSTPLGVQQPKAIWIVWTAGRNSDLESVLGHVKDGAIADDDDRRRLRHFLERNRNLRVQMSIDQQTGQTILECSGDRIVHRIELSESRS